MRTPHIVPLAAQAIEVLEMLRTLTGTSEWLFPGDRSATKPMSNNISFQSEVELKKPSAVDSSTTFDETLSLHAAL